jgi:hypothetical protein
MRRPLPLLVLLLAGTAACDQPQSRRSSNPALVVREEPVALPSISYEPPPADPAPPPPRVAAPDIAPAAAPGVAFNYRYAFRLAAPRIADVQERHAALCEQLTLARCRITGMLYRLAGPGAIEARLELKVDPAIARRFGRESAELVVRAQGMLTESEISGIDAGAGIRAAGRDIAELGAELARIEGRLRALRADASERPQLEYQAEQVRAQRQALRDGREAQQDSLATTPMVFQYAADAAAETGQDRSIARAARRAGDNFLGGVNILLIVVVTLLPWAAAALLIWWIALLVRRRWFPAHANA